MIPINIICCVSPGLPQRGEGRQGAGKNQVLDRRGVGELTEIIRSLDEIIYSVIGLIGLSSVNIDQIRRRGYSDREV